MEVIRFAIAAGETKSFVKAGRYLEVIEATAALSIGFYDANGSQTDDATNVEAGIYAEGPYSQLEVFSATAQTIALLIAGERAGSRRQPGNVRVIDEIGAACQVSSAGVALAITAFAQVTAFSPGSGGIILRSLGATIISGAGGFAQLRMIAAAAAPVSFTGTAQQIVLADATSSNGVGAAVNLNDFRKKLPAGWSIYAMTSIQTAAATGGGYYVSAEQV